MKKEVKKIISSTDAFVGEIRSIIDKARSTAVRSVDFCRVQMYWNIGKRIFEEEQHGKERADYGAYLIKNLLKKLEPKYGSGFSVRQLEQSRQFYRTYPIANTVRSQLNWSQVSNAIRQSKVTAMARNKYVCEMADKILFVGVTEQSSLYAYKNKYRDKLEKSI